MLTGGIELQRELQVPAALIVALNGVVVVVRRQQPPTEGRLERGRRRRPERGAEMSEFFTVSVIVATLASGIRLATPFLFAALGETLGQRSGVLNLGVEGVMLIGAYAAYYTALESDQAGRNRRRRGRAVMGVIYRSSHGFHAEQGISGIGIFLFGLGFTDLLFQKQVGTPMPIDGLGQIAIPLLTDIP